MKTARKGKSSAPASELISKRVAAFDDWRGQTLARMRALIKEADPDVVEEWKWVKPTNPGVPVWSHDGIICTGETYKSVVKLTFAKGASLNDPKHLFNSSLDGNVRRAIDIREGEEVNAAAFKALIREAIAFNTSEARDKQRRSVKTKSKALLVSKRKPKLLAGGNPQIAKADGDAPVQAYIAAIPGWKRDVARQLDTLITRTVPRVRKAVKWNSPFYGIDGRGWFLNFHCYTNYIKVAFFRGTSLMPMPPGTSKHKDVRYLDIREDDDVDEKLVAGWIRQASTLPGWRP